MFNCLNYPLMAYMGQPIMQQFLRFITIINRWNIYFNSFNRFRSNNFEIFITMFNIITAILNKINKPKHIIIFDKGNKLSLISIKSWLSLFKHNFETL